MYFEQDQLVGKYNQTQTVAVVEHPKHGRLLLMTGYGGEEDPAGGAHRWRHGMVVSLQPGDTLTSLRGEKWNDGTSLFDAVAMGMDDTRPIKDWSGHAMESFAKKAGLP